MLYSNKNKIAVVGWAMGWLGGMAIVGMVGGSLTMGVLSLMVSGFILTLFSVIKTVLYWEVDSVLSCVYIVAYVLAFIFVTVGVDFLQILFSLVWFALGTFVYIKLWNQKSSPKG